jgi:hypothetical protein
MTASSATFSGRSRRFHRLAGTVNVGFLAFLALSPSSSAGHFGLGLGIVHVAAATTVIPEMTRGDQLDDNYDHDHDLDQRRLKGKREPTAAEPTTAAPVAAPCGTCDAGTPNAGAPCSTDGPTAECGDVGTVFTCSRSGLECVSDGQCPNGKKDRCNVQTPTHGTCTCAAAPTRTPTLVPTRGPTGTPTKGPTGKF